MTSSPYQWSLRPTDHPALCTAFVSSVKVTLRHQRGVPQVHNTHNTQHNFRKKTIQAAPPDVSDAMVRFPRWPKNIFFASDFIADRTSSAAAAAGAAVAGATMSPTNPRYAVSKESTNRRGAAPRQRDDVGASNRDVPSTRRYMRKAPGESISERGCEAQLPRPRDKRGGLRMTEEDIDLESKEQPGNRSTTGTTYQYKTTVSKMPAATGKKEALFLEESASALLFLHSRFFRGVQRDDDLVCRLCVLCKEAGWMGNPKGAYSGLDPLVLEGLLAERLEAKKRKFKRAELQGLKRSDQRH